MSQEVQTLRLWPAAAPGSEAIALTESVEERSPEPSRIQDRALTCIARPDLTVWRPAQPNGMAVILAPGGGYRRIAVDKEGSDLAAWFAERGITCFVLKYRLPAEGHVQGEHVPLQDAQRAIRLVRSQAEKWQLDPARIGVMGCSAGGHVMASLATRHDAAVYAPVDAADTVSARPDFALLLYPVITMRPPLAHQNSRQALLGDAPDESLVAMYSCEEQVRAGMPPHFISLAGDDAAVPPENSVMYYHALRHARVSAQLHIFEQGGHGHAIRDAKGPVRAWPGLLENWLKAQFPANFSAS